MSNNKQPTTRDLFPLKNPRSRNIIGGYPTTNVSLRKQNYWTLRIWPKLESYHCDIQKFNVTSLPFNDEIKKKKFYMAVFAGLDPEKVPRHMNRVRAGCGCFDPTYMDNCGGYCGGWSQLLNTDSDNESDQDDQDDEVYH